MKEAIFVVTPFLTQNIFETYLSLRKHVSEFLLHYNGMHQAGLDSARDRRPGTTEMEKITALLARLDLPTHEYHCTKQNP